MNNIPETKYFILNQLFPNHKKEELDLYYNCDDRLRNIIIPSINKLIKLHCEAQLQAILESVRVREEELNPSSTDELNH
jgi:hypothetical protein